MGTPSRVVAKPLFAPAYSSMTTRTSPLRSTRENATAAMFIWQVRVKG